MIFGYPPGPHERLHGPAGYRSYTEYKPWLRDEFAFRCVYCLRRERFFPDGHQQFGGDHLAPQSAVPDRANDYDNLVYACNRCNSKRGARDLPLSPEDAGFGNHIRVEVDGSVRTLSAEGRRLIALLDLNEPLLVEFRRTLLVYARAAKLQESEVTPEVAELLPLLRAYFRYPDDLPDLSRLRPPGGNARPDGIPQSHLARRRRGELPESH